MELLHLVYDNYCEFEYRCFGEEDVRWATKTRFVPTEDIVLILKIFRRESNIATKGGYGAKVGFDFTYPLQKL